MAKISGLGWTSLGVGTSGTPATPVDIRNDCTQLDWATPRAVQDVTGIDKSAHERLLLLADYTINITGVFNPALSHTIFLDVSSTSVARATNITVGGKNLNMTGIIYTNYPITRAATGDLTWKVPGSLADGSIPTWS